MVALFAGGCFWCMQPVFDTLPGVVSTSVGYTGGAQESAEYKQVTRGDTGHVEAIQITYDPSKITYKELVKNYFENIDPFDAGGQFADRGEQYETIVFYSDDTQKKEIENFIAYLNEKYAPKKVATRVEPAKPFYAAEDYHQRYYEKNREQYTRYKYGSGRVKKLEELWGKP